MREENFHSLKGGLAGKKDPYSFTPSSSKVPHRSRKDGMQKAPMEPPLYM